MRNKLATAENTLNNIIRLSNTERGLSFQAMRQLYIACITSIADYGVQIWWRNQRDMLAKYQSLQNEALRRVLGAFKKSPIRAMEIEAAIPPPEVRFNKLCQNYALRILKMNEAHPISQRVSTSFPPFSTGIELDWTKYADWSEESSKIIPSQLFRLCSMIKSYLSTLNCEKIEHYSLTPWRPTINTLIDVQISSESKELESQNHQNKLKSINNYLIIYTDGSLTKDSETLGAGIASSSNQKEYHLRYWNVGAQKEVCDAEIYAIYQAFNIAYAQRTRYSNLWIFSDSQAAIQRLYNHSIHNNQELVNKIHNLIIKLKQKKNLNIHICWVPSHMNIRGNELADKAAKMGTKYKRTISKEISWAHLKRKIKESYLDQ